MVEQAEGLERSLGSVVVVAALGDEAKAQRIPWKWPYWADREREPGSPVPVKHTNTGRWIRDGV